MYEKSWLGKLNTDSNETQLYRTCFLTFLAATVPFILLTYKQYEQVGAGKLIFFLILLCIGIFYTSSLLHDTAVELRDGGIRALFEDFGDGGIGGGWFIWCVLTLFVWLITRNLLLITSGIILGVATMLIHLLLTFVRVRFFPKREKVHEHYRSFFEYNH